MANSFYKNKHIYNSYCCNHNKSLVLKKVNTIPVAATVFWQKLFIMEHFCMD